MVEPHEVALSPTMQGAIGVLSWGKFAGDTDLAGLVSGMHDAIAEVQKGDMRSVEAMLYGQAITLQTIFTNLARKAVAQEYLKQFQVNLSLALKAQAQCRATLEALAEIKNPRPVAFVKQANIANGPQQVNNAVKECAPAHAGTRARTEENSGGQNELLEASHGNDLDSGAQGAAIGADPHLEAVAAGHRAAHP